jgi:hypothetical protein
MANGSLERAGAAIDGDLSATEFCSVSHLRSHKGSQQAKASGVKTLATLAVVGSSRLDAWAVNLLLAPTSGSVQLWWPRDYLPRLAIVLLSLTAGPHTRLFPQGPSGAGQCIRVWYPYATQHLLQTAATSGASVLHLVLQIKPKGNIYMLHTSEAHPYAPGPSLPGCRRPASACGGGSARACRRQASN